MEFSIIPDKEALSECAWCQSHISEYMEVFGFGAKLKPNVDLSEYEGHCIEIDLVSEEKSVYMMVTGQGSEAKNEGKDGMFLVCSEACGKKLRNVLEKDISLGKMFRKVLSD
ncbi:MAG: hypothetical protein PVI82_05790 [Desulfobacterales bacterium]|jgi:hypothetical protein